MHLLSAQDLSEVNVEEVDVETGLDKAGDDRDRVDRVLSEVAGGYEEGLGDVARSDGAHDDPRRKQPRPIVRAQGTATHRKIQLGM